MERKEKLLVYPYDIEFAPVIRHAELMKGYEIAGVCSPSGWGLAGRDAGEAVYAENTGIIVKSNFEEMLESCDTVLFSESKEKLDFDKYIYSRMLKSIDAGKNLLCAIEMDKAVADQIGELCKSKGVYFKHFNREAPLDTPYEGDMNRIHSINTPVIFVIGIAGFTGKFEIQLSLREKFLKEGYRVSQIGSRNYCQLFGFHSFPHFMNCTIPEVEKVYRFNAFVKQIEERENPDVIIIGVPGAVMPYNNDFTNGFGITAYEISNALTPDAVVMSLYYADYVEEYFTLTSTSMRYKLGLEVDCYSISNVAFDNKSDFRRNPDHIILKSSLINDKKKFTGLSIPVFNILNRSDADKMGDHIINKLGSYAERCIL